MFKGLMSAFQTHKDLWGFAGYWTDVIAEYGKLTGWNLEKTAKASGGSRELDEFCRKAMGMGLSAQACAVILVAEGFHDPSVLDNLGQAEAAAEAPSTPPSLTTLIETAQSAARYVRWELSGVELAKLQDESYEFPDGDAEDEHLTAKIAFSWGALWAFMARADLEELGEDAVIASYFYGFLDAEADMTKNEISAARMLEISESDGIDNFVHAGVDAARDFMERGEEADRFALARLLGLKPE